MPAAILSFSAATPVARAGRGREAGARVNVAHLQPAIVPAQRALSIAAGVDSRRRGQRSICRAAVASPPDASTGGDESSSSGEAAATGEVKGTHVKIKGMCKEYNTRKGRFLAVDEVDLEIKPNSLIALLGPSGSGKTTLMRCISGLETPTGGQIFLDGKDMTRSEIREREIGFVFQNYALFRHMTVADNIRFGPDTLKMEGDRDARVQELLDLMQLPELGGRFPPQLSGGQRQRIALARALAPYPRLLLLDEPFGALDALVRADLREWLKELVGKVNVTTIMVTHDQEEAFEIATDIVVFNRGRIEQVGTPEEIYFKPQTPFVMNFVGDVAKIPSDHPLIVNSGFQTDKPMCLVRPGDIKVMKRKPEDRPATPAIVKDVIHLGWEVHYDLEMEDGLRIEYKVLRDEDDESYDLSLGQNVHLEIPPLFLMGYHQWEIESGPIYQEDVESEKVAPKKKFDGNIAAMPTSGEEGGAAEDVGAPPAPVEKKFLGIF